MKPRLFGLAVLPAVATMAGPTSLGADVRSVLADEGPLPELRGAVGWLNSASLTSRSLRGKVVLVDFWTYTCINSLRPLPYLKAWADKYKNAGLVVIGVHTPEFWFEKQRANVETAARDLKLTFPVAIDSNHRIWEAFDNQYWPAMYFVDARGRTRHHQFGEGEYVAAERVLQALLHESGARGLDLSPVRVLAEGIEAAPSTAPQSPETYLGYRRGERFASLERVARDVTLLYRAPEPPLDHWGLTGSWRVGAESASLEAAGGRIHFRFRGRDLHLVLAPGRIGHAARFRVRVDGAAPADAHGVDTDREGNGTVLAPRLYQLVRQRGRLIERAVEIEFLDPGVRAVVFTFG